MKISLNDLLHFGGDYDLTIRSLDLALYQAEVELAGRTRLLCDGSGKPLRFRTLQAAREALAPLAARSLQLVQQSAYDEMIGQPLRESSNVMAVPLEPLPQPGSTIQRRDA
jgi:hypothetical protein